MLIANKACIRRDRVFNSADRARELMLELLAHHFGQSSLELIRTAAEFRARLPPFSRQDE